VLLERGPRARGGAKLLVRHDPRHGHAIPTHRTSKERIERCQGLARRLLIHKVAKHHNPKIMRIVVLDMRPQIGRAHV